MIQNHSAPISSLEIIYYDSNRRDCKPLKFPIRSFQALSAHEVCDVEIIELSRDTGLLNLRGM